MIFVVRVHYANHVTHIMEHENDAPSQFNFKNFPELELVCMELESDLIYKLFGKNKNTEGASNMSPAIVAREEGKIYANVLRDMYAMDNACQNIKNAFKAVEERRKRMHGNLENLNNGVEKIKIDNFLEAVYKATAEQFS
jgi:hypothetical protein